MINQTIKDRMDQLYEQLNLYNYQYYVLDSPTIEDTEYDSLIRELEELEKHILNLQERFLQLNKLVAILILL